MDDAYRKCEDCGAWDAMQNSGHHLFIEGYGRCTRRAPLPITPHGHPHIQRLVNPDWPHTFKHEGCWDSVKK